MGESVIMPSREELISQILKELDALDESKLEKAIEEIKICCPSWGTKTPE